MTTARRARPRGTRPDRAGFSLVEVLVGLTLLAIALTSVAALDYNVMRRTTEVARGSYANATVLRQVNRFLSLPYDSLDAHAGCLTVSTGPVPNTACATVSTVQTGLKQVTIIVRLTGTIARPDTIVFNRSNAANANPLNTAP
jgi:prepilin-type N-terminal cleavage/methylation domain-containing protein